LATTHISGVLALEEEAALGNGLSNSPLSRGAGSILVDGSVFERLALFLEEDALELLGGELEPCLELVGDGLGILKGALVACGELFCLMGVRLTGGG
jgi:hypothetical protein